MKKRPILALTSLFLLSLLLASLYFLARRPLEDRLLDYVEQTLGVKATIGGIGWRWLPVPAITINQFRAESATYTLVLPQAHLILNPKFFISGQTSLAYARLLQPELVIKAKQAEPVQQETLPSSRLQGTAEGFNPFSQAGGGVNSTAKLLFPADHLRIVNGSLLLPERKLDNNLLLQAVTLTDLNGAMSSRANTIKIDLSARSNFAKALSLKGIFDLLDGKYQLDCKMQAFQLTDPALPSITGPMLVAHLEGEGLNRFQLQIDSNNSPVTLNWWDQTFQIAHIDAVTLRRHNDDFTVDIKELSLAEPRLRLHGLVARQLNSTSSQPFPEWVIDLSGADIDLAAVRAAILQNFGENPVAQTVCAIVRGGSATTARFAFQGGVADFQHMQNMRIWAEAKDIPITLPALPLSLDQASGPIAIIKGQLTGKNLTATIDKSHGSGGDLLLDLEKDEHGFRLDLDLDADLQNLHAVLSQIIPSPKFQTELKRFAKIKGQAQGHLRLGDDLRHFKTEVEVHKVEASGTYNRLPWPFTIQEGVLGIFPQQVTWEKLRGSIGAQQIGSSTGMVSWQDDIYATLSELDADLDLKSLFAEGTLRTDAATLALKDFSRDRFTVMSGQAELRKSSFSGALKRPKQWQFQSAATCRDLKVIRAGLPELSSLNVEATISDRQVDFAGIFALLDQELFWSGRYAHRFFEQWQGDLEINGEIGQRLGEWIKEKMPFPGAAFLKIPLQVEKFIISNQGPGLDSFQANGTILPLPQNTEISLQVSNRRQGDQIIDTATFHNGGRQGKLSYQAWPEEKKKSLLTWQGEVASETLDAFFQQHFLQSGLIHGVCSRLTEEDSTTYNGTIEAKGLRFLPESLPPDLSIDTLRLQADKNTITIEQADLAVSGAQAAISGQVNVDQGLHTVNLQIEAPHFAWKSIQKLFEVYSKKKTAAGEQGESVNDAVRGTINFDIGSFDYTRQTSTNAGEDGGHTFTSTPFSGRLDLNPAGIALQVDHGKVCGISAQAAWHFGNAAGEDTISFSSGKTPLSFAEALPCLGIKQSLILGPFSLEGELKGQPQGWRQGSITLLSSEGLIKRMTLLSKIFTAVNFADYLTDWHDLPDMKNEGLFYNDLTLKAHVDNNTLILDRTFIRGKGVNVSGRGSINLADLNSDLTFFIAPFKGLDWVVSNLPLVGKTLAGPKESILTFPVAVTGNIKSPDVTSLAPSAIGSAVFELFRDTVTLPFRLFQPETDSNH